MDFRSLVKDLASVFHLRIELRQIGVRDEAKMLGGLGPCGRSICCGTFLGDFQPVSIRMAKDQGLSLNPTKISGICGRLMCCLKYEQDGYELTRRMMPRVGKTIETPDGSGTVTDLNIMKERVTVRVGSGDNFEVKEYGMDVLRELNPSLMQKMESLVQSEPESASEDEQSSSPSAASETEVKPTPTDIPESEPEPEQVSEPKAPPAAAWRDALTKAMQAATGDDNRPTE